MEDLVGRVGAAAGLTPDTARRAIGIVFNFLQSHLPPDQSAALIDKVPGAREAANTASAEDGGGIMDAAMTSPAIGLKGLSTQLTAAGLGASQMQTLGREMLGYLRQHAGEKAVSAIGHAFPELREVLGPSSP